MGGNHALRAPQSAAAALCGLAVAAAFAAAFAATAQPGFSRSVTPGSLDHYAGLFGQAARARLQSWKDFVPATAGSAAARGSGGEADLLRPVNGFFNRLPAVDDIVNWRVEDYWATPSEFMAIGGGDCEDYAIAKYFTLKELGVPIARLRLVYASTWQSSVGHLVLAYYSAPGADPLIMDNLEGGIRPASQRKDLTPVYLFNDDDLELLRPGAPMVRHGSQSLRKWRDLLDKLTRELSY